MDLQTISSKIDNKLYQSRHDFERDVRLIVVNCQRYNDQNSPLYTQAADFGALFDKSTYWSYNADDSLVEYTVDTGERGSGRTEDQGQTNNPHS